MIKLLLIVLLQNHYWHKDSVLMCGKASYYAKKFSGRRTANGEIYNPEKYTCAHRLLPFGTILKVENPENCKYVWVKINDRGPYHRKRVIDLSLAAAKRIDILKKGSSFVTLEIVPLTDNVNPTDSVSMQYHEHRKQHSIKKKRKVNNHLAHKMIKKKQKKQKR